MHKFYKHKFYKKYKDEIWGKLVLSDSFSYNKKSVLMNYKHKIIRRYIKIRSKFSYYRKGFLKNLRRAIFLNKLARKNSRLLYFNIKNATALINRKIFKLKRKRFNKLKFRWKYYSRRNKNIFFIKKTQKASIKDKTSKSHFKKPKKVNLKCLASFKSLLFINSSIISPLGKKTFNFLRIPPIYLFRSTKSINISSPIEISLRKRFLYLNTLSFLIKKKFNLKNNKSFFYSVHVASPQKKIKKWSNFGLKKIYYKKVSLFLGFKKVSSFVNFYKKTAGFWGENEFFLFSLLERRLESFVLRSNLINSIYFIKKFIENGNVMINNIMVTNPLRVLQLGEIVSINKRYSKLMYFSLKSRLLKRKVILNFPDFIELDYKLLVGMVIRPPSFASLTKPVSFDLYTSFLSVNNH